MPLRLIVGLLVAAMLVAGCGRNAATSPSANAVITPVNLVVAHRLTIDPAHTALLVMDVQQGTVALIGAGADPLSTHIADAERAARKARVLVGFVHTAFEPGYPEVSPNNKAFSRIAGTGAMIEGSPGTRFDPRIAPIGDEPVITKHRVGAFGSTPLDQILRARNIDTIVLTGIATSGVVLSTLRVAADLDYRVIVLSDCVADKDSEVNRVLLDKVFPTQADVIDSADFIQSLNS
jgi:nicotinamidase-related amidase